MNQRDEIALAIYPTMIARNMSIGEASSAIGIDAKEYNWIKHWHIVCAKNAYQYADELIKAGQTNG